MKKEMQRTGRRGRKPGDGILKEVDPEGSTLGNAMKLTFGRTANDPVAEMVRTWRGIHRACEALAQREEKLGTARIDAAKSLEASDAELWSGKTDKDVEAIRYWKDKRMVTAWLGDEMSTLTWLVRANMELSKAKWFRRIADAIEAEVTADGQDTYPLHAAVLLLGQMRYTTNKEGVRCYTVGAPLDGIPRHTISQVCELLENRVKKPAGQSDDDWKRTVRRACREVGLPLLPDEPGPKPKKS